MTPTELTDSPTVDNNLMFRRMVAQPDLRSLESAVAREGRRRDIGRIASTLFCGDGIDPSIVDFARARTAAFWGMDEEAVDVQIAQRLLQKAACLIVDLRWLDADGAPAPTLGSDFPAAA